MADDLREIIEQARRDCPDVPDHAWSNIERSIRDNFGTARIYIAVQRKKSKLDQLAELDIELSAAEIARRLGVNAVYAKKLRSLRRKR